MNRSLQHQTYATDFVRGVVVGDVHIPGRLYYEGRPQSRTLWAENEAGLMAHARARKRELVEGCGELATSIYPRDDAWELRIYG